MVHDSETPSGTLCWRHHPDNGSDLSVELAGKHIQLFKSFYTTDVSF